MHKGLTLVAALALAGLGGCSEYSQSDRTLGGAAIGGLTGAAIGQAVGGNTGSTLAGAAIGGVTGAAIGSATTPEACTATDARGRPLRDEFGNPVMVKCP